MNLERTTIVFHFFLNLATQWQTNFNQKSLLEQISHLVEMSFRSHLVLCLATVPVSCRDKLLMQNLIPANVNFCLVKTIISYFFQTLLPPEATFTSIKNIFFNKSFILASGNLFSVQWIQYAFIRSLLSAVGNHD